MLMQLRVQVCKVYALVHVDNSDVSYLVSVATNPVLEKCEKTNQ